MKLASTVVGLALVLGLSPAAQAQTVVELFTSQSCSSCPPAEALLQKLSKRTDLVVLEWHVDYWNDLHTRDGRWKDPFSSAANTARQRAYNVSLRGQSGVYTPQAVVGGAFETVGSDQTALQDLIRQAARAAPSVRIMATPAPGGAGLAFSATGVPPGAETMLVHFRKSAATKVGGGENHGRQLSSANVVVRTQKLGAGAAWTVAPPAAGDGCALIVQERNAGRILGAAYCPD